MGKKHKKHHRSEKRDIGGNAVTPDRPSEPPLRLVLKVGKGSEIITTASPSPDHYSTAEQSPATPEPDHRHSHHKKKKKKRRHEHHEKRRTPVHFEPTNVATPEPETQEEEEMEESEEGTAEEGGWAEPPATKKLLLSMHERRANPSRHCKDIPAVPEKTPLLKVLENLQKTLQRKDVDGFFAWPVNDIIAPGYSSIILHPMDFSTMKKKIEKEEYDSVEEYKADFILMCENAMSYNRPETIYYKAAKKLMSTGLRCMSTERLSTIKRAFGFVEDTDGRVKSTSKPKHNLKGAETEHAPIMDRSDIVMDNSTMDTDTMVTEDGSGMEQMDGVETGKSADDDMDEDDAKVLIQEVLEAAKEAKDRLTARHPNSKIGFLRKDKAGTTTLAILNPARENKEESKSINLGILTGRLAHGTASIPGFKEDKRNKALPVSYLMYGPFSSYAPQYDSTFANLSKEESDLLYSTYGNEEGVKYAQSIHEYIKDSGDYVSKLVDNLLDTLTSGEHSKTIQQLKQNREEKEGGEKSKLECEVAGTKRSKETSAAQSSTKENKIDFDCLRSLADEGIDMSFLPELEKELTAEDKLLSEKEKEVDQKLGKTAELICDLERTQNERLGRKPPPHLQYIPGPSDQEHAIAEQLTQQLKELTAKTVPGNLAPTESIRKAMGITVEPTADSPPPPSDPATSAPVLPDTPENALPDDIAQVLEPGGDDVATTGDEGGKGEEEDDVDADVGDELLELLRDKGESSEVMETT